MDEKLKRKLESEDRAAITVNKLEQKMDTLTGYQSRTELISCLCPWKAATRL